MEYFGTNLTEHGHYTWDLSGDYMQKTWKPLDKFPFHPENLTNNLHKGHTAFYQGGGYSVIAIAGSPKDERPGTKSVFWIKEIISRKDLIEKIKDNKVAKKIIDAMPFEVKWNSL